MPAPKDPEVAGRLSLADDLMSRSCGISGSPSRGCVEFLHSYACAPLPLRHAHRALDTTLSELTHDGCVVNA